MAGPAFLSRLRERLSLRGAVVLAVVVGLVLPALVAAVFEMRNAESDARERLDRDAALVADVMSIAMRNPVWQVAPELGRGTAQAMLRDPRVVGIMVRFDDGRPFLDIYRSVDALAENVSLRRPVVHEGREIGNVTVTLSSAPMQRELAEKRFGLVWRFAVGIAVSLGLILWVLHRGLVGPLLGITASARRLADRQLDDPIALPRGDELGDLSRALDETRLALREAFEQLERRNWQLAAYADTLEARVEQRTADLSAANEQLTRSLANLRMAQRSLLESEKQASLGRLVTGIAHDLNTPLGNSVTVVSELDQHFRDFRAVAKGGIKRSEFEGFLARSQQGLDILRQNVERAALLISRFKQVAIDQSTERRRTFDLAQVVEETLSTLEHRFRRSPYILQADLSEAVMMDSYPGPLEQVIIQLVTNALTHGFKERSYGTVIVRAERLNRIRARLVVRDDGVGMDEDLRRHIFELYYRKDDQPDLSATTGLGMNTVYSIVTGVLGGRIEVQSRPGEGVACVIDLPLEAPKLKAEAATAAAQ